ncbi:Lysophosphatidic acid receptor 3 [Microtus ochrogaster]|uniref:Lysophosphatidic acid receptor 3 n=1 Tax=Microtus ochrogaster TaxID=79684 RepID=A0A8J6L240_MICOH|nr:Lysophosphatidic acid receptor 3 [Microtus ochrogaster]
MGARSLAKLLRCLPGPPELSAAQIRAWPAGGALPWELAEAPSRAGPGRPATSTPWTGKVARDSRSVAADAGEQALVSACPASSAADWPEPGRPVAPRSPEGMRQPPNTRLPGSAARASENVSIDLISRLQTLDDVQLLSTMNECHYDKRMEFLYNRSNTDTVDEWTGTKLLIVLCVGTFFCLFIFFSNSLVIAAVIKNRKFHFPFYYLLANLAAADFFAGIAYVFLMFNTGPVSKTLTVNRWFLRQGLLEASLTASLANLLVIAVERHMSIMRMRVHSNLTKKRVTLLILLVWAIAIFMGAVPTLGWNCLCNISACSSLAPIYSRSYLIFWAVSNLLAFFIMVVVYVRIYM